MTMNNGLTIANAIASTAATNGTITGTVLAASNVCENVVTTSVIDVRKPKRNGISDSPSSRMAVRRKPASSA